MARRRRQPLSKRAVTLLQRIASTQRALNACPTVEAVLGPSVAYSDWDSLQVLYQRALIVPADRGRLRVTRDGWKVAGYGRA